MKLWYLDSFSTWPDWTDAVCNDGSPAGFYYAPGDPSVWLMFLEGGLW